MALVDVDFQFVQRLKLAITHGTDVILADIVPLDVAHQSGMPTESDRTLGAFERIGTVDGGAMEGKVFRRIVGSIAVRALEFLDRLMQLTYVAGKEGFASENARTVVASMLCCC